MGLNIRIVKFSQEFVERGELKRDKGFYITEGYEGKLFDCVKMVAINYCPFCGSDLESQYKSDEYVQELIAP